MEAGTQRHPAARAARRRRMRRKRIRKAAGEIVGGSVMGLAIGGLLILAIIYDPYEPPSAPEHFGQVEYCGVWWDKDEYEAMMAERQEYLDAEAQSAENEIQMIREAQERYQAEQEKESAALVGSMDWDAEESHMLAQIAMAEAESEDTEGKALVILVVLNRVWSDEFPDTIEGVISETDAFTSYTNGRYDRVEPDADCWAALDLVMTDHWDESQGALYFERTPEDGESTWHSQNLETLFVHGNHTFYRELQ